MPEFLTTHATVAQIENIISTSKTTLVLVSPYIQLSSNILDRLKDAYERGVKIILVHREDKLLPDEKRQLGNLKNLSLLCNDRLHAKCYFNDDSMVITSMNLYEYSEKNSEMGVLLKKQDDASVFNAAMREVRLIIKASQNQAENADVVMGTVREVFAGDKLDAVCIRCGNRLPFDPSHALCDGCYSDWAEYENPDYPEHYCHACGKPNKTTKDKPLCRSCFSKTRK